MPVRVATLSVFANPWSYIDEHGRPMGMCPVDQNEHVADPSRLVGMRRGAELLQKATVEVVNGREHETRSARHKLHIEVDREPTEIPNTRYYCERLRAGELFAADAKTAAVAGLSKFLPIAEAEAKARAEAIAEFDRQNGEGACVQLNGGEPPAFFAATPINLTAHTEPEARADKAATTTKKGNS